MEQRPNNVKRFIKNIQAFHKQVFFWHVEESHQPTIESFFQLA